MDKRQIFKRELPKYMAKAGLKQIDLAKALGMSKSTVTCWVKGKAFPEIDTIQRIADVLGCKTDDLIVEKTEPIEFLDFVGSSQSFHQSLLAALEARTKPETPQEDAKLAVLWRSATLQAKRAAIAVLESMKEEKLK